MTSDRTQHAARVKPNVAPTTPNKAKAKWHQRGGAALALSPKIHRAGPLIIKRGLEKMNLKKAPDSEARQWHDSPAYAFEQVSAESAPFSLAAMRASLPYDGEQRLHHAVSVPPVHRSFTKLSRLSSPTKTISPPKKISAKKRSALRVKSKIGAIGGIRARKRGVKDSNGPARVKSIKRSRTILPSGLGDLLGHAKGIGANENARNKTRLQQGTFERMLESGDQIQMQSTTSMADVDVEMAPSSAMSPGFRWRTCFPFLSSTWRERRDSVDSTYSIPLPASPSDFRPLLSRPSSITFLFTEGDDDGDEEIVGHAPDNDPFEQPLPSATPSVISMASVDEDSDDSSGMDSLSDGATTPTMDNLNGSANQMLGSQQDRTQARIAKLSRFFGPEVLSQF